MTLAQALRKFAAHYENYADMRYIHHAYALPWHLAYAIWLHEGFDEVFSVEEWDLLLRGAKSAHTVYEQGFTACGGTVPDHDWSEWYADYIDTFRKEAYCHGYA